MASAPFAFEVGKVITRSEVQAVYGGSSFNGIETARESSMVFVYSDPELGKKFGYTWDGWIGSEGVFLYTGDGKRGDQRLKGRNRTLLQHRSRGFDLHLFTAVGFVKGTRTRLHRYEGQYALDPVAPWEPQESLDELDEPRTVIVFRLIPLNEHGPMFPAENDTSPPTDASATIVSVEAYEAETFEQTTEERTTTARRRESELVKNFEASLGRLGHQVGRFRLRVPSSRVTMHTDTYDETSKILYEAKGSTSRAHIRLAIGQLLDYRRFVDISNVTISVLVPARPPPDMLDLLHSLSIGCTWQNTNGSFQSSEP